MNFEKPLTYLITKGELTPENFEQKSSEVLETVKAAAAATISMVQIREKLITSKQLFALSKVCMTTVAGSATKLIVNGRPDIAAAAWVHGVHLPEDGLPVKAVRRIFPPPFLVGASVHGLETARSAKSEGADFVVFGPIFESGAKKGRGVAELAYLSSELGEFPVIAVGGMDENNRDDVLRAGAVGYAAIRYLNHLVSERQ